MDDRLSIIMHVTQLQKLEKKKDNLCGNYNDYAKLGERCLLPNFIEPLQLPKYDFFNFFFLLKEAHI